MGVSRGNIYVQKELAARGGCILFNSELLRPNRRLQNDSRQSSIAEQLYAIADRRSTELFRRGTIRCAFHVKQRTPIAEQRIERIVRRCSRIIRVCSMPRASNVSRETARNDSRTQQNHSQMQHSPYRCEYNDERRVSIRHVVTGYASSDDRKSLRGRNDLAKRRERIDGAEFDRTRGNEHSIVERSFHGTGVLEWNGHSAPKPDCVKRMRGMQEMHGLRRPRRGIERYASYISSLDMRRASVVPLRVRTRYLHI